MADDLKSLLANLRRSGILFYKDRAVNPEPAFGARGGDGPDRKLRAARAAIENRLRSA